MSCFSRGQTADLNVRGPIMILLLRFQTFLTGGVEEPFPLKGLLEPSTLSLSSFHLDIHYGGTFSTFSITEEPGFSS